MHITDLTPEHTTQIEQVAVLLVAAFAEHWPNAWPTREEVRAEVHASFAAGRISRVALSENGAVLGWIGGISGYDGLVWELHPLAVQPNQRRRGIGRALVADLEVQVRQRRGLTLTLGTDDEDAMTSLGGIDLYPNVWEHIARIRNLRGHPYEFYHRCGFVITGVVPDANGPGKPDILMAKRVAT